MNYDPSRHNYVDTPISHQAIAWFSEAVANTSDAEPHRVKRLERAIAELAMLGWEIRKSTTTTKNNSSGF